MKVVDGTVKVLGEWRVSPPVGSVPPAELTLSYFDVALLSAQVEYLLFFDFLGSTRDFQDGHFPLLQRSLSLTLSLFYPIAGRLVPSPDSNYPADLIIRYSEGDFVTLTLAESTAHYNTLVGNQPKEAKAFHPLVPQLNAVTYAYSQETKLMRTPLLALQVTVFPGSGVSIGLKFNHVVTDGFGGIHFLKSWAAISKAGSTDVSVVHDPPVFDRALLGDLGDHLEEEAADQNKRRLASLSESSDEDLLNQKPQQPQEEKGNLTQATFVIAQTHMETLRRKMLQLSSFRTKYHSEVVPARISTFAATCAFVWSCLAKSRPVRLPSNGETETLCFFIPANCRPRLRPPVPSSYFGNVSPISAVVEVSHAELTGENGVASTSRAIQLAIRRIDEGRVLEHLPSVTRRFKEVMRSKPRECRFSIAGSPMLRAYDVDFGWGRPRKIVFPKIELTEFVSLTDSRDEEGGVEIGLGGPEEEMLLFTSFFEEGLKDLC